MFVSGPGSRAEPITAPAGQEGADRFSALYREHARFTWRVLRHLGLRVDQVPDATQEVWLVVHRQLEHFQERSSPRTWLFGIAHNVARNVRRTQRRRPEGELPPTELVDSAQVDPVERLSQKRAFAMVVAYTETLDDTLRALFVAHLVEGLSIADAARAVGLEPTAAAHRVRAMRRGFQRWLQREQRRQASGARVKPPLPIGAIPEGGQR